MWVSATALSCMVVGVAVGLLVVVPAYGGRWVQTGSGEYTIRWDAPTAPPPSARRLAEGRYASRAGRYAEGGQEHQEYDEL